MTGRLGMLVVFLLGATALIAQAAPGTRTAPPAARASADGAFRFPSASGCLTRGSIRLTLVPQDGFASLAVRAGEREILQLSGLTGPASVAVALPAGTTRVSVSATTTGGEFLQGSHQYTRCARTPSRRATPRRRAPVPVPRRVPRTIDESVGGVT